MLTPLLPVAVYKRRMDGMPSDVVASFLSRHLADAWIAARTNPELYRVGLGRSRR